MACDGRLRLKSGRFTYYRMLMENIVYVLKKVFSDKEGLYTEFRDNGFSYPKRGWVEAEDWDPRKKCGGGLHGLEWGVGNFDIEEYGDTFVVIKVRTSEGYVDLEDKVKFRRGYVVLVTKSAGKATRYLLSKKNRIDKMNYSASSEDVTNQGYHSTSNQGVGSTSSQGYGSTSNQGFSSTSNQGSGSVAVVRGVGFIYRNTGKKFAVVMFVPGDDATTLVWTERDLNPNTTYKWLEGKIVGTYPHTPENITELKDWEVFVFGSNEGGMHAGGAAKLAAEKFGAIEGLSEGLGHHKSSYAFPTLNRKMKKRSSDELRESIQRLIDSANSNPYRVFLVTKVGCGIAGYEESEMIELFQEFKLKLSANIVLPKGWY